VANKKQAANLHNFVTLSACIISVNVIIVSWSLPLTEPRKLYRFAIAICIGLFIDLFIFAYILALFCTFLI